MKPILFNTAMVKAILEGHKTIPIDFYGKKFVAYDHKPEED